MAQFRTVSMLSSWVCQSESSISRPTEQREGCWEALLSYKHLVDVYSKLLSCLLYPADDPFSAASAVQWFNDKEWKGSKLTVSLAVSGDVDVEHGMLYDVHEKSSEPHRT